MNGKQDEIVHLKLSNKEEKTNKQSSFIPKTSNKILSNHYKANKQTTQNTNIHKQHI